MKQNIKQHRKEILTCLLLLLGNFFFFLALWLVQKYDDIRLDQILFQLRTPASGATSNLKWSAAVRVGLFTGITTAVSVFFYLLSTGKLNNLFAAWKAYLSYCRKPICRKLHRIVTCLAIALLVGSMTFITVRLDVFGYVGTVTTDSDFIEDHYVDANRVALKFPEQKRNLVYIFLESMETTFANGLDQDYIPELTALANENISFSGTDTLGGILPYQGTTWTAAAMISHTGGIGLKIPVIDESYKDIETFMPGVTSIGEILGKAGYNQVLLLGSDADFANRSVYFSENGNYEIIDIKALKEQGRLPADYKEWWGFEDEKLFAYAKEEITRLAQMGEPFSFTTLTVDTHFPDGYVCRLCKEECDTQYGNVLRCSSRQVKEFVSWLQAQSFYENTTVVIVGDHLTMDADFLDGVDKSYQRTNYNCIINAAVTPAKQNNRQFGSFDMYPTTLAALGVTIPGDRLGLGTNLFSEELTLTERYGYEMLDKELQKNSDFYAMAISQND